MSYVTAVYVCIATAYGQRHLVHMYNIHIHVFSHSHLNLSVMKSKTSKKASGWSFYCTRLCTQCVSGVIVQQKLESAMLDKSSQNFSISKFADSAAKLMFVLKRENEVTSIPLIVVVIYWYGAQPLLLSCSLSLSNPCGMAVCGIEII